MASRDMLTRLAFRNAYDAATVSDDGNTNGAIIDTQDYESVTFILRVGARTDGDYSFNKLEHGDASNLSDAADVPDGFILGDMDAVVDEANSMHAVGYVGTKRYVRMVVNAAETTSGAHVSGVAVLGHARHAPAS